MPVLAKETLELLNPQPGESYLDLTAGLGGHAALVLEVTKAPKKAILLDQDEQVISVLKTRFKDTEIASRDFLGASQELLDTGRQFDMILADLGVSSLQLDKAERGFSFQKPAPLDMRMNPSQQLTAAKLVNQISEDKLTQILKDFGQEPKARSIAKKIVRSRPVDTTDKLAAIIASSWRGHSKVHPATRSFQALRIAVNDELTQLSESLPIWIKLLAPGGRIAVISFHSLEDRIVKNVLADNSQGIYEREVDLLTKKPITAGFEELVSNPRSRSAKLRGAVKIKKEG